VLSLDEPVLGPDIVSSALGAFDELEFLGRGTFGETYRAVRGDDEYALKVIFHPDMPDFLWEREVTALRRVDHPNIVGFRASGRFEYRGDSYPYLECDFVNGGPVRARIASGARPNTVTELRGFLTGLLAGAGEIHDLGILHRDIKPENVALDEGDWGKPVLLDFGLARLLDLSTHTQYPAHLGTTAYMAPEQLRGQAARRRSDLFAIGAVVYEAGVGQHPFRTAEIGTLQALHDRMLAGPPQDPKDLSPAFDDACAGVVLRLLAYREHERLGVGEALRDLEEN
jgi:eukaryotic-like serine/threonine-protein kinase